MNQNNRHTYKMGIIGNCSYMAHVDTNANIAWLCWPDFDSSFVFGGLIDKNKGGHYKISPDTDSFVSNQYYIENTNVLCTEFETEDGAFRVTDFAPRFSLYDRYYKPLMLVRKIEPLKNSPAVRVSIKPMGDYGQITPKAERGSSHLSFTGLESNLRLTTNIPLSYILSEKSFILDEPKYLVLTWGVPFEASLETVSEDFLKKTVDYWRNWVKHAKIGNFHQKVVIRSALALKIHQFQDTGAILAAGTMSLPEFHNSGRNWDYRYCWMRDTYYTLTAFNNIGHFEEMEKYSEYIENIALKEKDQLQPLYKINGDSRIDEKILDLEGYLGNTPVRLGNQAYTHIQNDVYGQILLSLLPLYIDRRYAGEQAKSTKLIYQLLDIIEKKMAEPDAGLWEFRDFQQNHSYTYLFHWAGCSAAYKIALHYEDLELEQKANKLMKESVQWIEKCFDKDQGAYTQAVGNPNMDASLLQLITMDYLDPTSDITKNHLKKLEQELRTPEGLFYRYLHADDFGKPEVTFLVCSFWYVEALACVGRLDEAISFFDKLMEYSNHLGLFSEDVDSKDGSQWGNFPQAYSHVGLINAAFRIDKKLDKPDFL